MTAVAESAEFSPENRGELQVLRDPEMERIAELMILPDEVITEQRQRLWEVADVTVATLMTAEERRVVETATQIIDWAFFGQAGDPLPEGLVLVGHSDSDTAPNPNVEIKIDPRILSSDAYEKASSLLQRNGLDSVNETLNNMRIEQNLDELARLAISIFKKTPEYQFVASFEAEAPPLERERPLTLIQRAIRETQLTQTIRQQFGLSDSDVITPHSLADRALRRGRYRIDNETTLQQVSDGESQSPLEKIREVVKPILMEAYIETDFIEADVRPSLHYVQTENGGIGIMFDGKEDEPGSDDFEIAIEKVPSKLVNHVSSDPFRRIEEAAHDFLESTLYCCLYGAPYTDLDAIVDETLSNAVGSFLNSLYGFGYSHFASGTVMAGSLRNVTGEVMNISDWHVLDSRARYAERQRGLSTADQPQFATRDEMRRQEMETLGYAFYGKPYRGGMRLIQFDQRPQGTGNTITNDDSDISFTAFRMPDKNSVPVIPGYSLTRSSWQGQEYTYNPNADPYVPCLVPLPSDTRLSLAETYAELGLDALADSVRNSHTMTVEDLRRFIQANSRYVRPIYTTYGSSEDIDYEDTWPHRLHTDGLEDFKPLIKDDVLRVQCTGSAHFLKFSLELMFGKGCAGLASGYTVKGEGRITGLGHMQTVFVYDNQQYLLDATPSSSNSPSTPSSLQWDEFDEPISPPAPQHINRLPEARLVIEPVETKPLIRPDVAEQRKARVSALRQSLERQLAVVYTARNPQELYKIMVDLPKYDPVRRTLELTMRADRDNTAIDPRQLKELRQYLNTYAEAHPDRIDRSGLMVYDLRLIDMLKTTVEGIESVI